MLFQKQYTQNADILEIDKKDVILLDDKDVN